MGSNKFKRKVRILEKRGIPLLGLVLSVVAIFVSVWSSVKSEKTAQKQVDLETELRQSRVVLQAERSASQDDIIFERFDDNSKRYSAIYKQKYDVIVNNIGFVDASITSIEVRHLSGSGSDLRYGWFSGIGPWIYADEQPVNLPISVSPNQPKKISIEIGFRVPTQAWNEVSNTLEFGKAYDYKQTEKLFLNKGFPFFGQLEKIDGTSYGDKGQLQKYVLTVKRGDGKSVKCELSFNVSADWIQGEIN